MLQLAAFRDNRVRRLPFASAGASVVAASLGVTVRGPGLGLRLELRPPQRAVAPAGPLLRTVGVAAHPIALVDDAPTGRVFVFSRTAGDTTSGESRITVLDAGSGRVVHVFSLGHRAFVPTTYGAPLAAVDPRTGRVFVPTSRQLGSDGVPEGPGTVTVLDGRSGALLRTLPVGHAPFAVALDGRTRRVFVSNYGYQPTPQSTTSADGGLSVLDADSGRQLARMPDEGGEPLVVDERTQRVFALGSSEVDVLDAATGRRRARVVLSPPEFGDSGYYMTVDERAGRVLVGLDNGFYSPNARGLDASTGAVVYSLGTAQRPVGGPLAVDPHTGHTVWVGVVVTNSSGSNTNIYLADTRTGRPVRGSLTGSGDEVSRDQSFGVAIAADPAHGRAVLVTAVTATGHNGDQVAVIDTGSGRFRRVMELGAGPPAIAVDERAGRVFVANAGANTVSVLDAARL